MGAELGLSHKLVLKPSETEGFGKGFSLKTSFTEELRTYPNKEIWHLFSSRIRLSDMF